MVFGWLGGKGGKAPAYEVPYPDLPAEAIARRSATAERLRREKIPFNQYLPVVATEETAARRSETEIAERALALIAVSMKACEVPEGEWSGFVAHFGIGHAFTPAEAAFLADPDPSPHDLLQFSWRFEAMNLLLWAIGHVKITPRPEGQCDAGAVWDAVRGASRESFLAASRVRPMTEILDQADLIYCYRWALVEQQIGRAALPQWLNDSVAMERQHALTWLIETDDAWDDISLDT